MFRPRCPACDACRSLRIIVEQFQPNRSQRRARNVNEGVIHLKIGRPAVTQEKLDLYDAFHAYQAETKGWPEHAPKDATEYASSFVENPFPIEEWCYYLDQRSSASAMWIACRVVYSAIYFVYDPNERHRSLGTWNVLTLIDQAEKQGLPHVYLGYFVDGCRSLAYKANFLANEVLAPDGSWRPFRS